LASYALPHGSHTFLLALLKVYGAFLLLEHYCFQSEYFTVFICGLDRRSASLLIAVFLTGE
jgi:hypothetical protein